jgi:hypothetical protein
MMLFINFIFIVNTKNEISLDYYRQSIGGAATALHNYLEEVLGIDNKNTNRLSIIV